MENNLNLRERILGRWGRWASIHWGRTLLIGLIITLIMTMGVSRLKMEMTFFSIMPGNSQQVRDLKRIMNEFPLASGITVVIDARDIEDPEEAEAALKNVVDALVLEFGKEEYADFVKQVNGKADIDFFRNHGLMLSSPHDIERFGSLYSNLNLVPFLTSLNNDLEREYGGSEENLKEDEAQAVAQFAGLGKLVTLLEKTAAGKEPAPLEVSAVLDDFLFGESYFLSKDNRMALIMVLPTFTMEDYSMLVPGVNAVESAAKRISESYGLEAGLTGLTTVARDEMVTSEQGLAASMLISFLLILLLMVIVFRMKSAPLITGIPLMLGIYWAMGMTGFTIHRLNIMTAMYMVALVGLGIDFAIHLLTAYTQERDGGLNFLDAMEASYVKTGSGILTGALTTAMAFFALLAAETEMMKELGIVAGIGIIFELAAMILLIPALMGFRQWRIEKRGHKESVYHKKGLIRSDLAAGLGIRINQSPLLFVTIMLALVIALSTQTGKVSIERNLLNLEAKGLESVELQDRIVEEFQMGAEGLLILAGSLEEVKFLDEKLGKLDSVKQVDSIAPLLPTGEENKERALLAEKFHREKSRLEAWDRVDSRAMADELIRLEMNLLEMADMAYMGNMQKMLTTLNRITGRDNNAAKVSESSLDRLLTLLEEDDSRNKRLADLQEVMVPILKEKLLAMASSEPVTMEILPAIYRDSYISRLSGEFLVSVIPTQNPWEGEFRDIYTTQVATVTDKGAGMIMAADQLSIMAEKDGIRSGVAAFIAIFLILLLDFRNLKLTLLTLFPLVCSFLALFGFMGLTGIKFDFINIIAVPLLMGIGIDDSVHISHRYLIEGKGRIPEVIAKTGTAVLLTSVTTVIAFASFIPSIMRAMRSTGIVLSVAMIFAFIFAIILYPALLVLLADRTNLNFNPWKRGGARK